MSEMSEYAEDFRRRVQWAQKHARRTVNARMANAVLARACRLLGVDPKRFEDKVWRLTRDLKLALAKEEDLAAAEADCAGSDYMRAEVERSMRLKHDSSERDKSRSDVFQPAQARREATARRSVEMRRRHAALARRLPEPEPVDLSGVTEEAAPGIVAREVSALLAGLELRRDELYSCKKCDLAACVDADGPGCAVLCSARGLPTCAQCRTIMFEADRDKLDLLALTGGGIDLERSDLARRPGRPRGKRQKRGKRGG